jgi:hypothetical protein
MRASCRSSIDGVAFAVNFFLFSVPLTEVVADIFHLNFFLQLERVSLKLHVAAGVAAA